MNKLPEGAGTALVTPFTSTGEIDFSALEKIIEHNISGGMDFLVSQGTTGEAATLSLKESEELLSFTKRVISGRVPLFFGLGGNHTSTLLNRLKTTDLSGVDALLSVSPYYSKPNRAGLLAHYRAVAENSPIPVIVYNVPGRTGSNLSANLMAEMLQTIPNISGIKEASGNLFQGMELLRTRHQNSRIYSGDDLMTFPLMCLGADGVISVISNLLPRQFSEMTKLIKANRIEAARDLHFLLMPVMQAIFEDGNPGGIKAGLEIAGLCQNHLRLPLAPVESATYKKIEKALELVWG